MWQGKAVVQGCKPGEGAKLAAVQAVRRSGRRPRGVKIPAQTKPNSMQPPEARVCARGGHGEAGGNAMCPNSFTVMRAGTLVRAAV